MFDRGPIIKVIQSTKIKILTHIFYSRLSIIDNKVGQPFFYKIYFNF